MTFTTRPEPGGTFGRVRTTRWRTSAAAGIALDVVEPHLSGPPGDMPALPWSPRCRPVGLSKAEFDGDRDMSIVALHGARHFLNGSILEYPTPTASCDAQFTELLGERNRVDAARPMSSDEVFILKAHSLAPGAGGEIR